MKKREKYMSSIIDPKITFDLNNLFDALVPSSGPAETLAGEVVRACAKLRYDFYNNGMGNNTSGAINFLRDNSVVSSMTYDSIYAYSRGRIYDGNYNLNDNLHKAIEEMSQNVIDMISRNPIMSSIENKDDMFDFEDEEEGEYF